MRYLTYFSLILLSPWLFSCDENRIYEANLDIEKTDWNKNDTLVFDFNIEDPNQAYNLYYNLRYSNSYPFYNLFTKYFICDSSGVVLKSPAVAEDMYLFDVKTGKPLGKGLGDIYDQQVSFLKGYKFPAKGDYKIKVLQYMRNDPLPGIVSFGIRVEKAEQAQ